MFAMTHTPSTAEDPVGQRVQLRGVAWETYVALADGRGDRATPRLTYADGTLEITSPAPMHERVKKTLARLIELYAWLRGIDVAGLGSTTFRDETRQLGLEPDECYYLGAERDGVPDIAIEVVWQHGGLDKLRIFAGLGVPEVWMWRRGSLSVYRLAGSTYEEHPRSALLPELDVQYLAALAMHPDQAEATRLWARFVERQ
ncbi:MAG: Uma2 family endonuclease [bacterium]